MTSSLLTLSFEFEQDDDDDDDSADKEFAFGDELDSLVDDDELLLRAGVDIEMIESSNNVRVWAITFCWWVFTFIWYDDDVKEEFDDATKLLELLFSVVVVMIPFV